MIPIPISTPHILALFILTAVVFFLALILPAILELRKPRDAGPRRIFESDGKEIVGFNILLAVYFREGSKSAPLFLEDIEPREFSPPSKGFLSILLPDMEF